MDNIQRRKYSLVLSALEAENAELASSVFIEYYHDLVDRQINALFWLGIGSSRTMVYSLLQEGFFKNADRSFINVLIDDAKQLGDKEILEILKEKFSCE